MNEDTRIISALSSLGYPIFREVYDKGADNSAVSNIGNIGSGYLVFNYSYGRGVLYGDDAERAGVTGFQVHLFTKDHTKSDLEVRRALEAAGFAVGSRRRIYENDTGYIHFIVEAELTEE